MTAVKSVKYGIPLKTAAAILSFITAFSAFLGICCSVFMFENSFYARSRKTVKVDLMTDMLRAEAHRIANNYIDFNSLEMTDDFNERFSDSNLYYTIELSADNAEERALLVDNMNPNDAFGTVTVNSSYLINASEFKGSDDYSLNSGSVGESGIIVLNDGSAKNTDYAHGDIAEGEGIDEGVNITATVTLAVKKSLPANDKYSLVSRLIDRGYSMRYGIFVIILTSLLATVVLWIYLFCAAGRSSTDGELRETFFDRVPFDLLAAASAIITVCTAIFVMNIYPYGGFYAIEFVILFCAAILVYFTLLGVLLNFASQVKKRRLLKGTVCYRLLYGIYRLIRPVFVRLGFIISNINLIVKSALICGGLALAELFLIVMFAYEPDILILWWLLINAVVITAALFTAVCLVKLKKGGEEIAGGDLDYKIDTTNMRGDFKRFGESLNHINEGMQAAVNEKMKSERMKTELITNVSHDIKTPLTSIINYVDLIKKEKPENPVINEYIAVLDRQSNRLKKLIEDLVEASKASSGVLKVTLSRCDAGVLLSQAAGEYEERLTAAQLSPVLTVPEQPVYIMADGRYLWRVFDNLMNNICKYTQAGTRVYTDLSVDNGRAVIVFKNVSKYPLNISGDELMERFVRGDSSRSTEGSGLGLSIAQSLTELQGGSLGIKVDGDLFKVVISFPVCGEGRAEEGI